MPEISHYDDVIDSRDIIARIAELEGNDEREEEESDELAALVALQDEAKGYCSDWLHGETLIHDDYFEKYARQLAEDIGAINGDEQWPANCIDWERAASELQSDYSAVDFDGQTYWTR